MIIGISPTVDFAFKLLFGSPDHTRVTIHFLNAILALPSPVRSVTIQNPFLGKGDEDDRLLVLDILAVDQDGRTFNIEMQTTLPAGMKRRLAYHVSRIYGGQLNEGDQYTALRPAVVVCVLTKPLFPEAKELHLDFRLREATGRTLTDDLQIHLLQLSNLTVTAQNVSTASPIEQWAYFMLNSDKMTVDEVKHLFPDEEFAEAAGVLEMISQTPEQRMQYDARLKFQMDEAARLEYARDEGLQKGRQEGRQEGEQKGRQEGLQHGELLGQIGILQSILGLSRPTREELSTYDLSQLTALAKELQQQLSQRGQ